MLLLVTYLLSTDTVHGNINCLTFPPEQFQNEPIGDSYSPCPSGYGLYSVDGCFDRFDLPDDMVRRKRSDADYDDRLDLPDERRQKRSDAYYDRLWLWECRPVCIIYIIAVTSIHR